VGALQLAFQQLKEKLKAEGLFNPEHKKKLPFLPRRIGMVTSATGAAVRDVLKVLSRRFPNLEFFVIPASVQGEKAAPEIVAGIERAEKWNIENPKRKIDVLIVGRGGGFADFAAMDAARDRSYHQSRSRRRVAAMA
jgi:exodeoxyribonuclease VII large subunit